MDIENKVSKPNKLWLILILLPGVLNCLSSLERYAESKYYFKPAISKAEFFENNCQGAQKTFSLLEYFARSLGDFGSNLNVVTQFDLGIIGQIFLLLFVVLYCQCRRQKMSVDNFFDPIVKAASKLLYGGLALGGAWAVAYWMGNVFLHQVLLVSSTLILLSGGVVVYAMLHTVIIFLLIMKGESGRTINLDVLFHVFDSKKISYLYKYVLFALACVYLPTYLPHIIDMFGLTSIYSERVKKIVDLLMSASVITNLVVSLLFFLFPFYVGLADANTANQNKGNYIYRYFLFAKANMGKYLNIFVTYITLLLMNFTLVTGIEFFFAPKLSFSMSQADRVMGGFVTTGLLASDWRVFLVKLLTDMNYGLITVYILMRFSMHLNKQQQKD